MGSDMTNPLLRRARTRSGRLARLGWALLAVLVAASVHLAVANDRTSALGAPPNPVQDFAVVHRLVFDLSLDQFTVVAGTRLGGDRWLDWTTDWCSAPLMGSTGRTYDFRAACRRHDFAYRNTKLLDVRYGCSNRPRTGVCRTWTHGRWWNADSRAAIDQVLRRDMRSSCSQRSFFQRPICLMWSEIYYRAVRIMGGP